MTSPTQPPASPRAAAASRGPAHARVRRRPLLGAHSQSRQGCPSWDCVLCMRSHDTSGERRGWRCHLLYFTVHCLTSCRSTSFVRMTSSSLVVLSAMAVPVSPRFVFPKPQQLPTPGLYNAVSSRSSTLPPLAPGTLSMWVDALVTKLMHSVQSPQLTRWKETMTPES